MLAGAHSYTYQPSEVSHTVAKRGDTDKWTTALSALVHSDRAGAGVELKPRDLLRLDNVILEVELKKASVGEDEIKVRCSLNSVWFATEHRIPLQLTNERFIFSTRTPHSLRTHSLAPSAT
jgi:hypothetical protein